MFEYMNEEEVGNNQHKMEVCMRMERRKGE